MMIRREKQSDIEPITEITKAAFQNHPYSRKTEHCIIHALRAADALTLSLVADVDGRVVGHIAFSPVSFTDGSENWYGLGPVSVLPDCQKQGIGKTLVNKGLQMLQDLGAEGCVLVGDPDYYQRFGFTSSKGLQHEGVPQENVLALAFGNRTSEGLVHFHPAFAADQID